MLGYFVLGSVVSYLFFLSFWYMIPLWIGVLFDGCIFGSTCLGGVLIEVVERKEACSSRLLSIFTLFFFF